MYKHVMALGERKLSALAGASWPQAQWLGAGLCASGRLVVKTSLSCSCWRPSCRLVWVWDFLVIRVSRLPSGLAVCESSVRGSFSFISKTLGQLKAEECGVRICILENDSGDRVRHIGLGWAELPCSKAVISAGADEGSPLYWSPFFHRHCLL